MPEVIINGPEGRIECRYMPAEAPNAPTALILHPEPDRGGTMNNRVTYALYQHFKSRGFAVMRFNFRGVAAARASMTMAKVNFPMRHRDGLAAVTESGLDTMLDCRLFIRVMDWHAADDAPSGNSRIHIHQPARHHP